jgi:hypothetical protein
MGRVLVACEYSGRVREAFRALGHDAWSCDLLPADDESPYHHMGDVIPLLSEGWDLMVAHPPCTYLCSSGIHWNARVEGRAQQTEEAVSFFLQLWEAPIPRIAVENPVGVMSSRLRKPDQYIQPWEYGEPETKKTCLWLKNLPALQPTLILPPEERRNNLTPSGQNKLGPSPDRWKLRSLTYQGWADAMAQQWGPLL